MDVCVTQSVTSLKIKLSMKPMVTISKDLECLKLDWELLISNVPWYYAVSNTSKDSQLKYSF